MLSIKFYAIFVIRMALFFCESVLYETKNFVLDDLRGCSGDFGGKAA